MHTLFQRINFWNLLDLGLLYFAFHSFSIWYIHVCYLHLNYFYSFFSNSRFDHIKFCRAGTIRSAADSIRNRYIPCRYDTYSIHTLPIRYVFDTYLADTIRIRYDTPGAFLCRFQGYALLLGVRWHAPPQFILLHWRRGILGTL